MTAPLLLPLSPEAPKHPDGSIDVLPPDQFPAQFPSANPDGWFCIETLLSSSSPAQAPIKNRKSKFVMQQDLP